jgi:hypothetical protein
MPFELAPIVHYRVLDPGVTRGALVSIRRKSGFGAAFGFAGALFLAALTSCVGPDLEPPFSGGTKDSAAPATPATPTTSGAAGGSLAAVTAGRSSSAEGASPPQVSGQAGTTGTWLGAAGKPGGPTMDAGVADEDAGTSH